MGVALNGSSHDVQHQRVFPCSGLLGEGAVQVLYSTDEYKQDPILAAVGQLQFEVEQTNAWSIWHVYPALA